MQQFSKWRAVGALGLVLLVLALLSNSSNPPNGYTNAPGDSNCTDCHSQTAAFNGVISVNFPSTITPGTTYPLTVTITYTSGTPNRAGFQAVILNGANANIGSFSTPGTNVTFTTSGSRTYAEHNAGAKTFGANTSVSYTFSWTAPSSSSNNSITMYISSLLGNGSGTTGDTWISATASGQLTSGNISVSTTGVNPSCSQNNGSVTATPSGGSGPYTFAWSNNGTGATISSLGAGTYTVTCTSSGGFSATASKVLTMSSTAPSVSVGLSPNTTQLNCNTTSIVLTAAGNGVTYNWGGGITTASRTVTAAGLYIVTATSTTNGCTTTAAVTISQSTTPPVTNITAPNGTSLSCTTTSLNLFGSGGTPYSWSTGATTQFISVTQAGVYTVTATGSNGCTSTKSITITTTATPPQVTISATGNGQLNCANTSVIMTATGGGTYTWSGGGTAASKTVTAAGVYTVTVTTNGCTATSSFTVTQSTTPPAVAATGSGPLTCTNPSAVLTATGGGTYMWSNSSTTSMITVTAPGTYTVTVMGANNCTASSTVVVTTNTLPPNVSIQSSGSITCASPQTTLTAGSTGNVTYMWSQGTSGNTAAVTAPGVYTVTVTNLANGCTASISTAVAINTTPPNAAISVLNEPGCNTGGGTLEASGGGTYAWSTGATTSMVGIPGAGVYTVTVTGTNGCTATSSMLVQSGNGPTATITVVSQAGCSNNAGVLTASGGGTYAWSIGSSSASIGNLAAGTYTVTVTDQQGCTATASATLQGGSGPQASITIVSQAGCNNAGVLTASGGGTYAWSNGSTSATIGNLAAGTYTVTVTDQQGCTGTASAMLQGGSGGQATITIVAPASCNANTGVLTATGGGTYAWSNGSTSASIGNLAVGTYTVTVNNNGCTATASVTLAVGGTEVCNGVDDDCDQLIDEGFTTFTFYQDLDGDGYGNNNVTLTGCTPPQGYITACGDCNDSNMNINIAATEVAGNGIDDDCNGSVDDACANVLQANVQVIHADTGRVWIYWPLVNDASTYNLQYRVVGTTTWSATETSTTGLLELGGLMASTNYEFRMRTKCGATFTSYWTTFVTFQTRSLSGTCIKPTGRVTVPSGTQTVRFYWDFVPGASKYSMRYRVPGGAWIPRNIALVSGKPIPTTSIVGLVQGQVYEYQLRALCPPFTASSWSAFSTVKTFVIPFTNSCSPFNSFAPPAEGLVADEAWSETSATAASLTVAPNPTNGELKVTLKNIIGEQPNIVVADMTGRVLMQQRLTDLSTVSLDVSGLTSGLYILSVQTSEGIISRTFVRE